MSTEERSVNQPEEQPSLSEQRLIRRAKLKELQDAGQDPFQITKFVVKHHSADIKEGFEALEGAMTSVAGRIMSKRGMGKAVPAMAAVMLKLLKGGEIADPEAAGVFPKGIRKNMFYEQPGAERAVQMLIKKLNGEAFRTEYPMPVFDRVEPRPAIADISKATIAIVTSGGIVPFGNPDHIAASSAQNYGAYDLDGVTDLRKGEYMTAHGGYDQTYANADPDRVLPIDVLRDLEKEGKIGKLYHVFYSTVGNGTSVANARKFGTEIGSRLKAAHVDGVILTST